MVAHEICSCPYCSGWEAPSCEPFQAVLCPRLRQFRHRSAGRRSMWVRSQATRDVAIDCGRPTTLGQPRRHVRPLGAGIIDILSCLDGGDHCRTGIVTRQQLRRHRCGYHRRVFGMAFTVAARIFEVHVRQYGRRHFGCNCAVTFSPLR